jgi:iron-sulfur cluster repair protein YtfE (RIC family)
MTNITDFMASNHEACDNQFARAEEAALAGNWSEAESAFNKFRDDMARHFRMEEDVLFPEFSSAGGPAGPVHVMLMEHAQMKELLAQMADAVAQKNAKNYGGLAETLLIVMQQHNHKEENILYGMADGILANQREALLKRMQEA